MALDEFPSLAYLVNLPPSEMETYVAVHRRYSLSELYTFTKEALAIAQKAFIGHNERVRLENIMHIIDYQTSHDFRSVRSIFMPRRTLHRYRNGNEEEIIEPERWSEPFVQQVFKNYFRTLRDNDNIRPDNTDLPQDQVYSVILNPRVRERIEKRRMREREYGQILKIIEDSLAKQTPLPELPSGVLAIQPYQPGALVPLDNSGRRQLLNNASPALLSVESRLSEKVVSNLLQAGLTGIDIVDASDIIRRYNTTTQVIRELKRSGISADNWETLIELKERFDISVADGIRRVQRLDGDIEELMVFVEELQPTIYELADRRNRPISQAFDHVFRVYLQADRTIEKTRDIITGDYKPHLRSESDEELVEVED